MIRFPNGNRDKFYAGQGVWVSDLREAISFERLSDADTLCEQLKSGQAPAATGSNSLMADMKILPQLQVMFWGIGDGDISSIPVIG